METISKMKRNPVGKVIINVFLKRLATFAFILFVCISVCGQQTSSHAGFQNISTGQLFFEYRFNDSSSKKPTILFEAGALSHSTYWDPVIESVSKHANTLRYDRAGLGQSRISTQTRRSVEQVALELKELVDSLNITGDLILVCHSMGAYYGRAFNYLFPARVKALVLLEGLPTTWEAVLRKNLNAAQNQERDTLRQMNRSRLSETQQAEYEAAPFNREYLDGLPKMTTPTYVIHGTNHSWPADYNVDAMNQAWSECQEGMGSISTRSESFFVEQAGHHLLSHFDLSKFLVEHHLLE